MDEGLGLFLSNCTRYHRKGGKRREEEERVRPKFKQVDETCV